jgi:hypothetical protein
MFVWRSKINWNVPDEDWKMNGRIGIVELAELGSG